MAKKEVPDLNSITKISADYFNDFYARELMIHTTPEKLKGSIMTFPIKKYEQYFSSKDYINVVNSKNKKYVKELDEIVDILNTYGKSELSIEDFNRLILKVKSIIYKT